jgi:hypothetical protein
MDLQAAVKKNKLSNSFIQDDTIFIECEVMLLTTPGRSNDVNMATASYMSDKVFQGCIILVDHKPICVS